MVSSRPVESHRKTIYWHSSADDGANKHMNLNKIFLHILTWMFQGMSSVGSSDVRVPNSSEGEFNPENCKIYPNSYLKHHANTLPCLVCVMQRGAPS
jgi:hypothetical protein